MTSTVSMVVRIDPELLARYDALAARAGLSRSEALRLQMRRAVDDCPDLFALGATGEGGEVRRPRSGPGLDDRGSL